MTAKERDKDIKHWQKVITTLTKKADKRGYSLDAERQEKYLAESKIKEIRDAWQRATRNTCNGNCKTIFMIYDKDCPLHGW